MWLKGRVTNYLYALISLIASSAVMAESNCNPLSVHTCVFPFPSNHYATEVADSPTGVQINYPDDILPQALVDGWPERLSPSQVFNGLTGYSALTPVLFEFEDAIDITTLPLDGGESVKVFDYDTGEQMAIRADTNMVALAETLAEPSMIVETYPRSRWTFGNTYVAVVTKALKNLDGNDFVPSAGVKEAISANGSALSAQYEPYIRFLKSRGVLRNEILSLTYFTVRDEASVTDSLKVLIDIVAEESHPMTIASKIFFPAGDLAAVVSGQVKTTDFRREDGDVDYTSDSEHKDNWGNYSLYLPHAALTESVPVVIYGHGIGATKETGLTVIAESIKKGVAVVLMDHPYHGSRVPDEPYYLSLFKPETALAITGSAAQSPLDFHSLLYAIKENLKDLDILPGGSLFYALNGNFRSGRDKPDINVDKIYYMGTSLGGLLGSTFAATAPGLKGAYLEVAGAGINNAFNHSSFYHFLNMDEVIPKGATGAESVFMLSLATHRLDRADGLNYAHYFRHPPSHLEPRPLALQYGIEDQVFYDGTTYALAEAAELPLYTPAIKSLDFLDTTDNIEDGYVLFQSPQSIANVFVDEGPFRNSATDLISHLTFFDKSNIKSLDLWIDRVILGLKPPAELPATDDDSDNEPEKPGVIIDPDAEATPATPQPDPQPVTPTQVQQPTTPATNNSTQGSGTKAVALSSSSGGSSDGVILLLLLTLFACRFKTAASDKTNII